ncbi:MAG: hypothetical protein ABF296_11050 [Oceanococcaceae bacterium]
MSPPVRNAPAPVWLLAAPFSGVTSVAAMLNRYPELWVTGELDLLLADRVSDLLAIFSLSQGTQGHGLLRTLARLQWERDDSPAIRAAQQWLEERQDWPCSELLNFLRAAAAPRRLVIPERDAPLRPHALRRITAWTPDADLVHVVRHPLPQGKLLAAWAHERLYVPVDFKDFSQQPPQVDPQLPWLRANENIERLRRDWSPGHTCLVHADTTSNSRGAFRAELEQALGLSDVPALARPEQDASAWRLGRQGPDLAPGGYEPEADLTSAITALGNVQEWSLTMSLPWRRDRAGFTPEVRACARRLGYDEG